MGALMASCYSLVFITLVIQVGDIRRKVSAIFLELLAYIEGKIVHNGLKAP